MRQMPTQGVIVILCSVCGDEFESPSKIRYDREGRGYEEPTLKICGDCEAEMNGEIPDDEIEGEEVLDEE